MYMESAPQSSYTFAREEEEGDYDATQPPPGSSQTAATQSKSSKTAGTLGGLIQNFNNISVFSVVMKTGCSSAWNPFLKVWN